MRVLQYHESRDAVFTEPLKAKVFVGMLKRMWQHYAWNAGVTFNVKKILDIGTGRGYYVKEACEQGYDAYGMDLESRRDIYEGPPERFCPGDIMETFPFADSSFDLVHDCLSITDLINLQGLPPDEALKHIGEESRRVLRVGGYFLSDYNVHGSNDGFLSFHIPNPGFKLVYKSVPHLLQKKIE